MKNEMEAAKQDALNEYKAIYSPKVDECIGFDYGFGAGVAYARGSQWVAVNSADDLPTQAGKYLVWRNDKNTPLGDSPETTAMFRLNDEIFTLGWLNSYLAYMPIPPYTADSGQEGEGNAK